MRLFNWFKRRDTLGFLATEYHPELEENLYNEAIQKAKDICEEHYKPKPRISAHAQIFSSFILKNYKEVIRLLHYQVEDWSETAKYDILGNQWRFDWYSERAIEYYKNGAAPTGFREFLASQDRQGLFTPEESLYIKHCCIEAIARQEQDEVEYQRQQLMKLREQS